MSPSNRALLRASLVTTWLVTALVSALEWHGHSLGLLTAAGMADGRWADALIGGGIAADLMLGLALWWRPGRTVYLVALAVMLAMTLAGTVLLPSLWMHPLGPLLKNLPIAAVLWVLAQTESRA